MHPLRPIPAFHQGHGEEMAQGFVGVQVGAGDKTPHDGGAVQSLILLMDDEEIAVGSQEDKAESRGNANSFEAVSEAGDGGGGQQCRQGKGYGIALQGDQSGEPDT